MAKSRIPKPLERRHLIVREIPAAQAAKIAAAYLEEGRRIESIDFLAKAGDREALADLRTQAVAEGDLFLLRAAAAALGEEPGREEWIALADAATAAGKERYAVEARRQSEIGDGD